MVNFDNNNKILLFFFCDGESCKNSFFFKKNKIKRLQIINDQTKKMGKRQTKKSLQIAMVLNK